MIRRVVRIVLRGLWKLSSKFKKKVPVYIPVLSSELLKGRTALITGGTSGIGYEIAKAFLSSGARVVITGRTQGRVDEAARTLGKECVGIVLDSLKVDLFTKRLEIVKKEVGEIDILVNNAGLLGDSSFGFVSKDSFDAIVDTNLRGPYMLSQVVAKIWIANKIQGNILNICSSSSFRPADSPYALSKWGLRSMTLGLAKRLIPYGIVVNGIAPGPTATSGFGREIDGAIDWSKNPQGRLVTPTEVANLATVLVSRLGRSVVGDVLCVSGGAGVITFDDV